MSQQQRIHLISIGGSVMHNLAIALHKKGHSVTGSDDQIFEPSKSRLEKYSLLPKNIGWKVENISQDLDVVILGMHAKKDNPELLKAQELGIPIYSFPEFAYEQTKEKNRAIIGGSHGKTSITAMILHVMNYVNQEVDFLIGALLEGFECMVQFSNETNWAIFEGDEYLSSPIDLRPKFHLYQPTVALLSGIAWDHINVFPTYENYVSQFQHFITTIDENGALIYCQADEELKRVCEVTSWSGQKIPYTTHPYQIENGITFLITEFGKIPLLIFGEHNLMNLNGARLVCNQMGIKDEVFYKAIQNFTGASKRLELVVKKESSNGYFDFAHSPSKLKATTAAVKNQFANRRLVACMELHTFSSLNKDFLDEYHGSMTTADKAFVFFNPETIKHKGLDEVTAEEVKNAFGSDNVTVFTSTDDIVEALNKEHWNNTNLLLMTSGNFGGLEIRNFLQEIIQ